MGQSLYLNVKESAAVSVGVVHVCDCVCVCVETKHNPRTEQGCNVHLVRCQVEGIENVKQVVCLCVCFCAKQGCAGVGG